MDKGIKITAGIIGTGALLFGGVDATKLEETPIERVETIANERVEAKQIGNVVETTLPWKGEAGIKVSYNMGEPTVEERLNDKRKQEVITETVDFGEGGFKIDVLLSERPDSNRFCYTIEGAENYDFFYQPPLTEEELKQGIEPIPEFEGSYAVYHKSLKNNQYKTGKVMHIPRPQVWEVDNKEATTQWGDLSYESGELCVTASQDFLDKATYPVRIDPTFGYTPLGVSPSCSALVLNVFSGSAFYYQAGTLFSLTEDADITKMSGYFRSNFLNGSPQIQFAIFDSSFAFVASTSATSTTINTSNEFREVDFSSPISLTAGNYYLLANGTPGGGTTNSATASIHCDAGGYINQSGRDDVGSFTFLTPFVPTTFEDRVPSIYATYTTTTCDPTSEECVFFAGVPDVYSWTPPTGVTSADVACWGAAGGGGVISTSGGAGGGGGAFASSTIAVTAGTPYALNIGRGGAADSAAFAGASSFASSSCPDCVIAAGGQGASPTVATTEGAGGTVASSTGTIRFAGGSGGDGNGTNDVGGGGGGSAGPHGAGVTAANMGAGNTTGGAGGNGDNNVGGAGGAASAGAGNFGIDNPLGGGGGGGANDNVGGAGGRPGGGGGGGEAGTGGIGSNGQCIITYTAAGEDSPPFAEDFEDADAIPGEFDSNESYGTGNFALDSTSKVNGTYSTRCDIAATDDGCVLTETVTSSSTYYAQVSVFLPAGFAIGASGYLGFLTFGDGTGSPVYCNLEDFGTVRLICDGDELAYTDTSIDIPLNTITQLEFRVRASTTAGVLQIWKNNDVEGSPDYSTTTVNTGADPITEFSIGGYHPDIVNDKYYDDICVSATFLGASCFVAAGASVIEDFIIWFD